MASEVFPFPSTFKNFPAIIFTFQFTPVTPAALLPAAPMMPATRVPCPLSSMGLPVSTMVLMPWISSTHPFPSSSIPFPAISPGLVHILDWRSE